MAQLMARLPPHSEVRPVTDVLHGIPVTDRYRWREDGDPPRTRASMHGHRFSKRGSGKTVHSGRRLSFQVRQLLAACQSDLHDKTLIDLRRRKSCEALNTEFSRNLEGKTHGKLQAAGGIGADSLAEERRGRNAHEILPVDVIEDVKGISGNFKFPFAVVASRQMKSLRDSTVGAEKSSAVAGIAGHSEGPVVKHRVIVIVAPGGDVEWRTGIRLHNCAHAKAPR